MAFGEGAGVRGHGRGHFRDVGCDGDLQKLYQSGKIDVLQKLTEEGGGQKALPGTGAAVCLAPDVLPLDRRNWLVPAWTI